MIFQGTVAVPPTPPTIERLYSVIGHLFSEGGPTGGGAAILDVGESILGVIETILFWLGVAAFFVIVYVTFRISQIQKSRAADLIAAAGAEEADETNDGWPRIMRYMASTAPSDWRIAIIEADTILDDLLNKMGYIGPSIGEKLKTVEPSDFHSLEEAWEAHRRRNEIVHDRRELSRAEAEEIIKLYEIVFREFGYI